MSRIIDFGEVDLTSRIHLNRASYFLNNARDCLPFDIGNFNLFFAAGLLISYATGMQDIFGSMKLNYDYFDEQLPRKMRLNYINNFYSDALEFYSRDKSREYMRSYGSDKNLYSISLQPSYGFMQPTISNYVNIFEGDWQKNLTYEIFVFALLYQMFINTTKFKTNGFYMLPNISKCDVELTKTFQYKWNLTPFNQGKCGSEPHFPQLDDINMMTDLIPNINVKTQTFLDALNNMKTIFWQDMLCIYRIGHIADDMKSTQLTFDMMKDLSLRTFISDKLVGLGYDLKLRGAQARPFKRYKMKIVQQGTKYEND